METILNIDDRKFTVRAYRDDDENGVRTLWQAAFGKQMPVALWKWKYLNHPYRRQMVICVGETGEIVVSYTGIPYRTHFQGRLAEMTQLMDIMSHPDYRKTGLFIKTAHIFFEMFGKDILFVYGFPGKYHYDIGEKYLGYQALTRPVGFLSARIEALVGNESFHGRFEPVTRIDEAFDRLWERCQADFPLSIVRNSDFVRWRFQEHPLKTYAIYGYWRAPGDVLSAYAVFFLDRNRAVLADILMPRSEIFNNEWLQQAAVHLKHLGAEIIETWLPMDHFITTSLLSSGFVASPEPLGIIPTVRNFEQAPQLDWTSTHLFYTMADADLV